MRKVKTIKVETPQLIVSAIKNTEDLEELGGLLKNSYVTLGKSSFARDTTAKEAIAGLFLSEDGQSLKYKTYRSAYGNSVDEFTRTLVSVGQFLITNQNSDGEIISNPAHVPSRLLENVIVQRNTPTSS